MSGDTSIPGSTCPSKKIQALLRRVSKRQVELLGLFAEIEKEVATLTDSNEKLKITANENAELVRQTQVRSRRLKQENETYKQENQALKKRLEENSSPHGIQNPESDHSSSKSGGREDGSSDEQPDRTERRSSKLSTNKQNKKVRYKELPSEEKISPVLSSRLPGLGGGRENQDPEQQPFPAQEEKVMRSKSQNVKGHSSRRKNQNMPSDLEMGRVLVPETIPVELISDDEDGSEEEEGDFTECVNNESSGTDLRRLARKKSSQRSQRKPKGYLLTVPETVPMESIPYARDQDSMTEDPLIGDDRENKKYLEHLVPLEQSTPMLLAPSSDSLRRKTLSAMNSASPVYADGKSHQKSRIPPTESQLSVDFSTTQMSPTFNRSRSTPNRQDDAVQSASLRQKQGSNTGKETITLENRLDKILSTPENVHSITNRLSSRSKTSHHVWDTPEDTNQSRKDPTFASDNDESGQSEASFLILQPSSRGPSQVRSSAEQSKKEVVIPYSLRKLPPDTEGEQRKKRRLSDGPTDETASKKTRMIKQEDFDSNQNNEKGLCNKDGRRADFIKTESSGQTASRSDQSSKNSSKLMKQTRLTKDSFKAVVSEEGRRLRDLNGGSRVYVDSQDDPYMKQAIQESMAAQNQVDQDGRTCNGNFKVPRLPKVLDHKHKSKSSSSSGTTSRQPHPEDNDNRLIEEDEDVTQLEERSNLDYNNEGDLNGSLDPAVRFSFIGDEEDEDDDGEEDQKLIKSKRTKHGNHDASVDTRKPLLVMSDDSQADQRRGLHSDSRHSAPKESRTNDEDLERSKVKKKHLLLVEDSLDDMFEDDDADDDDDVVDDGHDEDRQQHGREIEEGYGVGDGDIPETSVQGRIKSEEASLHDPDVDVMDRHPGETDEMGSSFVREFDRPPQRDDIPAYKYKDVVRKRDERQKLKGVDCKSCTGYYQGLGLTSEEIAKRTKNCSKHRYHYSPPNTPEHYWSIDFPDTEACIQRGYLKEAQEEEVPKRRRKNRYLSNVGKNKPSGED